MKYLIYILTLWFSTYATCTNAQHKTVHKYPAEIENLGLQKKYDISKWYLYCTYCDKELKFYRNSNIKEKITYGMLPLNFEKLTVKGDTIEMRFYFSYKDKHVDAGLVENYPHRGTVFLRQSNTIYAYASESFFRYIYLYDPKHREVTPLQKDVKDYIIKNQKIIDPWFLAEAKRRKVL